MYIANYCGGTVQFNCIFFRCWEDCLSARSHYKTSRVTARNPRTCHVQLPEQPPWPFGVSFLGISLPLQPNTELNNLLSALSFAHLNEFTCLLQEHPACSKYAPPLETIFFVVPYK